MRQWDTQPANVPLQQYVHAKTDLNLLLQHPVPHLLRPVQSLLLLRIFIVIVVAIVKVNVVILPKNVLKSWNLRTRSTTKSASQTRTPQ